MPTMMEKRGIPIHMAAKVGFAMILVNTSSAAAKKAVMNELKIVQIVLAAPVKIILSLFKFAKTAGCGDRN